MDNPLPEPRYIKTPRDLVAWVDHLTDAALIAVDMESDSLHHYREKVCLIQMTAKGEDVLIDPLALPSLVPLAGVFSDPLRCKVFHDAGYDLMSLRRDFDFKFANVFDTMLASRILGYKKFGLAAMLKGRFGFIADKRLQRSDWAMRPLSAAQIAYARYDTHFLPALYEQLKAELMAQGRLEWAQEEFSRLPEIADRSSGRVIGDIHGFWRIKHVRTLSPVAKGRLMALYRMREYLAERLDRPRFKVLSDSMLMDLAKMPPKNAEELLRPGIGRAAIERFSGEIMRALRDAQPISEMPPEGMKRRRRSGRFFDPETRERYDALRALRSSFAENLGLDPEVALSNAALETLARHPPRSVEAALMRPELRGWRRETFAQAVVECLVGM